MNFKWILLAYFVCFNLSSSGQCPGNDSVIRFARSRDQSEDKLVRLLQFKEEANKCSFNDSTQTILMINIGALYADQGNYLEAIRQFNDAIQFVSTRERSPSINLAHLVTCYNNLIKDYDAVNNLPEKVRAIDSAVNIGSRLKLKGLSYIFALIKKAQYLFYIGDYNNCLSYTDVAFNLSIEYGKSEVGTHYGTDYAGISSAHKMNALMAMKDYKNALELSKYQIQEYRRNGPDSLLGTAYGQLAAIESDLSNYTKAQSYYDTAFELERKYGTVNGCKVILNNIGILKKDWYKSGDAGIPYYYKSINYRDPKKSPTRLDSIEDLNAFANLGYVYSKKNKFDSSFDCFSRAYQYYGMNWNELKLLKSSTNELLQVEKVEYLVSLFIMKADTYLQKFKFTRDSSLLDQALRMYIVIDKLMFRIKTEQSSAASKLAWRTQFHQLYESAIEACLLKNNIEAALYFFERSKSVLLSEQLNEERWTTGYEIMKQNQVKKQMSELQAKIEANGKSTDVMDSLKRELFARTQELDALKSQIKANNPLYFQYSMDTSSITLKDVREKLLKNHDAFLELFSGDSALYVLFVTHAKIQIKKFERYRFDSLSNSFTQCLSNNDFAGSHYNTCTSVSSSLFHYLFDGFDLPKGRIIISPDGKYFPFEALVVDDRNGHLNYFVNDHAVSYTYSARYLLNTFASNTSFSVKNVMGVAPVEYAASLQLPSLKGSDVSVDNLLSHFSSVDKYLFKEATRNNFLQNFYRYKINQIYTHATDSGYNKEPVIYFADSALMLSDLLYEKPPATQLIVLSGCETGSGKVYEGEGVFSFNRGFAGIGVPSCVANLWQVENTSTYQLTELFYAKLAKGLPIDIALQEAKKEFIATAPREKQLPYYWAAPILTGRTEAIELRKNYMWIFIAAGVCLAAFVVFVVVQPRMRTPAGG